MSSEYLKLALIVGGFLAVCGLVYLASRRRRRREQAEFDRGYLLFLQKHILRAFSYLMETDSMRLWTAEVVGVEAGIPELADTQRALKLLVAHNYVGLAIYEGETVYFPTKLGQLVGAVQDEISWVDVPTLTKQLGLTPPEVTRLAAKAVSGGFIEESPTGSYRANLT